jgi:hypothetical protein
MHIGFWKTLREKTSDKQPVLLKNKSDIRENIKKMAGGIPLAFYRDLEPTEHKFRSLWMRPKRQKSQAGGQTEISLKNRILRSDAKAHRW